MAPSLPTHSLTRGHGNVLPAGKHVQRVYLVLDEMNTPWSVCGWAGSTELIHLQPAGAARQRRRRRRRQLEKPVLACAMAQSRHGSRPRRVHTIEPWLNTTSDNQTPTPRYWRHVHVVPHVAFLPRRNTLCPTSTGLLTPTASCVVAEKLCVLARWRRVIRFATYNTTAAGNMLTTQRDHAQMQSSKPSPQSAMDTSHLD
jgi:hypothetical protein